MGIYDVPATEIIELVAADLEQQVQQPEWIEFVKTGRHRERAPHRRNWFYVRMASILYQIYKNGNKGTNRLCTYYGGRKNRGVRKHHFYKASGKVVRVCLQELEKLGYLKKEKSGRKITGKGESFLNSKSTQVTQALKQKKEEVKPEEKKEEKDAKEEIEKKEEVKPVENPKEKKEETAEKKTVTGEKVREEKKPQDDKK